MPLCDSTACSDFPRDTGFDAKFGQPGGDGSVWPQGEEGTCDLTISNMYGLCHIPVPEGCDVEMRNVTCSAGRTAFTCPMCGDSREECDGGDCMWLHDSSGKGEATIYSGDCVPKTDHWGSTMVKCGDGSLSKRCRACREDVCNGDDCQWVNVAPIGSSGGYSECRRKDMANLCPDGTYSRANCRACPDGTTKMYALENNICELAR